MMNTRKVLLQWFINLLIKSQDTSSGAIKSKTMPNQQLADELHKLINRKFKKYKVYSSFKDNIWGADLADMQLIKRYNEGI